MEADPFLTDIDCSCSAAVAVVAGLSEARVRHLPASQLPSTPAARFAALFAAQPRWTREQLDPYLAGLKVGRIMLQS
jgi:hypothetical protein